MYHINPHSGAFTRRGQKVNSFGINFASGEFVTLWHKLLYKSVRLEKVMSCMKQIIFILLLVLLFLWRIRRGFHNGIMKELVTIFSGALALVSLALVFVAISSYREKALNVFTVCVIAIIVVGIVFKISSLILRPILALSSISVIGAVDRMLGAVLGAIEAAAVSYIACRILSGFGISVF